MEELRANKRGVLMKPGKDNREDRLNFIEFWANYIRTYSDEEWSRQQKFLIDSQIKDAGKLVEKR